MSEFNKGFDGDVDELWGMWDGQCQACDRFGRVNDLSLCEDCAAMLDRDLIRLRDWEYSAMAFGVSPERREELRRQVIAQFGEALELIAPPEEAQEDRSLNSGTGGSRNRRKRKKRRDRKRLPNVH